MQTLLQRRHTSTSDIDTLAKLESASKRPSWATIPAADASTGGPKSSAPAAAHVACQPESTPTGEEPTIPTCGPAAMQPSC